MDPTTHPTQIGQVLGRLVKKWELCLPNAVRALEKFNHENKNVLLLTGKEKQEILDAIKLKTFKGLQTGLKLDLSKYRHLVDPLIVDASQQKAALPTKGGI